MSLRLLNFLNLRSHWATKSYVKSSSHLTSSYPWCSIKATVKYTCSSSYFTKAYLNNTILHISFIKKSKLKSITMTTIKSKMIQIQIRGVWEVPQCQITISHLLRRNKKINLQMSLPLNKIGGRRISFRQLDSLPRNLIKAGLQIWTKLRNREQQNKIQVNNLIQLSKEILLILSI